MAARQVEEDEHVAERVFGDDKPADGDFLWPDHHPSPSCHDHLSCLIG
jgi:hypothetical protein